MRRGPPRNSELACQSDTIGAERQGFGRHGIAWSWCYGSRALVMVFISKSVLESGNMPEKQGNNAMLPTFIQHNSEPFHTVQDAYTSVRLAR